MKIGVIDIGSNSVRLMLWVDGKTLFKQIKTTRLGDGLNFAPRLKNEAIERTALAVKEFKERAEKEGAEGVYAFATAAVRSAENGAEFVQKVLSLCGVKVEVLSGLREAEIGLFGALKNSDGGIIDVGGASTEVTVRSNGKVIYTFSANVGTVRILDGAGRDYKKIKEFVADKIKSYPAADFSSLEIYAVGGTASRLGAIKNGIKEYRAEIINGTVLYAEEIHALAERLCNTSVEEIKNTTICGSSADLIGGGAELMASVMDLFGVKKITVSESDNLEGYAAYITRSAEK